MHELTSGADRRRHRAHAHLILSRKSLMRYFDKFGERAIRRPGAAHFAAQLSPRLGAAAAAPLFPLRRCGVPRHQKPPGAVGFRCARTGEESGEVRLLALLRYRRLPRARAAGGGVHTCPPGSAGRTDLMDRHVSQS